MKQYLFQKVRVSYQEKVISIPSLKETERIDKLAGVLVYADDEVVTIAYENQGQELRQKIPTNQIVKIILI